MRFLARSLYGLIAVAACTAACAHLPNSGLPGPVPSVTPSSFPTIVPSSSPGMCTSLNEASNTTVLIVMSTLIGAATPSPYGIINGYVAANPDLTYGTTAAVISARSTDVVQFVNVDNLDPVHIHSAVGLTVAPPFPTPIYSFPPATQNALGSTINSTQWSTGRLSAVCFSQTFTLAPGTFYFGDFDYYNSSNTRDVIVVSP